MGWRTAALEVVPSPVTSVVHISRGNQLGGLDSKMHTVGGDSVGSKEQSNEVLHSEMVQNCISGWEMLSHSYTGHPMAILSQQDCREIV